MRLARASCLLLATLLLASCGGESQPLGELVPNTAPNTFVSATPPVLTATGFQVSFHWTGADPDGVVEGFEWRISSNGADGVVDVADTLTAYLPWRFTAKTDSTFLVQADLPEFPPDAADPRHTDRSRRFWQTHTFFIRAVDEGGARDPTPASVSFTATTLAPTVNINLPAVTIKPDCLQGPLVLTFGWEAEDPDLVTRDPSHIRYLLMPYETTDGKCSTKLLYDLEHPIRADNPLWSRWIPYDAASDSGRIVTFDKQPPDKRFLFAVQARDVAGAVTPTFEWGRNVRHIQTTNYKYPQLTVSERFLGDTRGVSRNNIKAFDVVEGQPLEFSWNADASDYGGIIDVYRYGWDVQDPDDPNDPGWALSWGRGDQWQIAPLRSFEQGTHNFVAQCRDNSGAISRITVILRIIQIPDPSEQRELILIDDWRELSANDPLDARWDDQWNRMLNGVLGFQPNDVIEAFSDAGRVSFATLADYRSVIWFVSPGGQTFIQNQFAPASRTELRFNWLEVYQARVGNILLTGPGALSGTVEQGDWVYPLVFNVASTQRLGFGLCRDAYGQLFNCGTLRWPYTGWCVSAVDRVRPPVGSIFGEHESGGIRVRTKECDVMYTALLDRGEFLETFPSADTDFSLSDLRPMPERANFTPYENWGYLQEEIYNANTTRRSVNLVVRDCQVPMFRWLARRDAGIGVPTANCLPPDRPVSTFDRQVTGLASQVYSDSKPTRGASDFVWGFNPMGFRTGDVQRALDWILQENWRLNAR